MKKKFYLLTVLVFAFAAMSFLTKGEVTLEYPDSFSPELKAAFASEYVETVGDKMLHSKIENQLSDLFSKVKRVDLQYSEDEKYYYHSIYGEKDGKEVVRLLKLDKQKEYSSVDFSLFNDDCSVEPPPGICPSPAACCTGRCQVRTGNPQLLCMLCIC